MDNKNTYKDDKEVKDIFSGMENYMKKPLNLEEYIMQKIESEKDYAYELEALRKKVQIGQIALIVLGFFLALMFLLPVITPSTALLDQGPAFEMLPTLYSILVLIFGFSYMRIKTQSNQG